MKETVKQVIVPLLTTLFFNLPSFWCAGNRLKHRIMVEVSILWVYFQ